MTGASLRDAVAKLLADRELPYDPATTFTRRPAPFLRRHEIWALDYAGAYHAVFLFVAWAEGGPARLLSGRPEAFVATARADGVTIASPEEALAYATALLEATRPAGPLLTLLRSAADLPVVPDPSAGERAAIDALEIAPPVRAGGGRGLCRQPARDAQRGAPAARRRRRARRRRHRGRDRARRRPSAGLHVTLRSGAGSAAAARG